MSQQLLFNNDMCICGKAFFIGRLCNYLGLWYIKYINESQVGNGNSISSISKDGEKTESIFTDIF